MLLLKIKNTGRVIVETRNHEGRLFIDIVDNGVGIKKKTKQSFL